MTLKGQVNYMRKMVETCETSYPLRVEMKRMTQKEADHGLTAVRSILETLEKAEAAGGVAESALKELAPAAKSDTKPDLTVVVHEVHRCAKEHMDKCEHCAAIANILDESGSVV